MATLLKAADVIGTVKKENMEVRAPRHCGPARVRVPRAESSRVARGEWRVSDVTALAPCPPRIPRSDRRPCRARAPPPELAPLTPFPTQTIKKAQEVGVKVKELQEELENTEIEAVAADGGVTVTISGAQVTQRSPNLLRASPPCLPHASCPLRRPSGVACVAHSASALRCPSAST